MNTLLYALFEALRRHRWLRMLACAFVFTSLGNGLTQVVIFGLLLSWKAPASLLTVAYLFATLPGFIGSLIGEKLCRFYSPVHLLILTELLGLMALLFPLLGIHYHSVTALLAVQSTEALLTGMSWPALTLLFKRALTADELPAATCLENVIFASQVLLGMGLGIVLFDYLPVLTLLARRRQLYRFSRDVIAGWKRADVKGGRSCQSHDVRTVALEETLCATETQPPASSGSGSRGGARDGTASRARAANPPDQRSGAGTPFAVCP